MSHSLARLEEYATTNTRFDAQEEAALVEYLKNLRESIECFSNQLDKWLMRFPKSIVTLSERIADCESSIESIEQDIRANDVRIRKEDPDDEDRPIYRQGRLTDRRLVHKHEYFLEQYGELRERFEEAKGSVYDLQCDCLGYCKRVVHFIRHHIYITADILKGGTDKSTRYAPLTISKVFEYYCAMVIKTMDGVDSVIVQG